jgi:predicted helicase
MMADPTPNQRDAIRNIRTFPQLIKFLRDELEWPIESDDFEELTFDYTPEELGIDTANAAKIQEIKRLRPLSAAQPWGIFFVKFEPKRLPVVALRRVLSRVVLKKRASANSADRAAWQADDLLFVSNYGEGDERQISFAHFSQHEDKADLPTLKVLGWDNRDTPLHLDDVADTLHQRLAWPENDRDAKSWRDQWRSAFTLRHLEVVTTSKDLAVRLADLARAIRDRIQTVLAIETENGPLTKLMKAFQQALIHDLSPDDFADMYAQTIAYGLLSARVANPTHDTADAVATHIPVTNPFLKELMETFLHLGGRKRKERGGDGIDFDELGVSEVVELLDAANMEAVVRDFGDRNRDEDPVIHFYELFLKEYDAKKRMQRGVFYTPQPVVSYIVRSVHELLQTEFGLEDGLASIATWADLAAQHTNLKIPDGANPADPFVVILDPATGTATFLVEVIDVIHSTLMAKWKHQRFTEAQQHAAWNAYVPKNLLPRLHGYELLMAPYAIAHMKIGLKLYETGYRFGSDERARIYLTNALEPASDDKRQREFEQWVPALAHESQAVNAIKRRQQFTVVIGNPPYSASISEPEWLMSELDSWKEGLNETKIDLNREEWKFVRFGQLICAKNPIAILGYVVNRDFLDGVAKRKMRESLQGTFPFRTIVDLNGDVKGNIADENVFEITQGVCVALLCRGDGVAHRFFSLVGKRQDKYALLSSKDRLDEHLASFEPSAPYFRWVPFLGIDHAEIEAEYLRWIPINEIFRVYSSGIQTKRDGLCVNFDELEVWKTVRRFHSLTVAAARQEFELVS